MRTHESPRAQTHTWLTPPHILTALGPFDLDPCAAPEPRPWPTATEHWTELSLIRPWHGRVWLNPPYGPFAADFLDRLADHGNGIALIFARTETATFFPWVWSHATALLFLKGRVRFYTKEGRQGGSAGAPSVLIAYGPENAAAIAGCGLEGAFVPLPKHSHSGSVD